MDRRAPVVVLASGAVVGAVYTLLPPGAGRWGLQVLATVAAAALVSAGVRTHRPRAPWPWHVMTAGLGLLAVAGVVGGVMAGGTGPIPEPAVAVFDFLGGVTIACGVIGLVHVRTPRGAAGVIDAGIIAAAGTALLWMYAAVPTLEQIGAGTRRIVAVALLVCLHAVSLAGGVRLLVARGWHLPAFWALLGSGLLVTAGSLPFVLVARQGLPPTWMPASWLGATALLAAAAVHPSMRELTEPLPADGEAGWRPWRWVFLGGAAMSVPLVGFVTRLADGELLSELASGAALVVVVLVVWRTYGIVRARDRAAAEAASLAEFNAAVLGSLMSLTAVLDHDGRVIDANDHWTRMALTAPRGRLWSPVGRSYPGDLDAAAAAGVPDAAHAAEAVRDVLGGRRDDAQLELAAYLDGERRWFIMRVSPLTGRRSGVVVSHHDITWRMESEEELRVRADQQATVSWLGQQALTDVDLPTLLDEAATMVAVTLSIECVTVFERLDSGSLVVRAGIGWSEAEVGVATVGGGSASLAGYALEAERPVVVDDIASEERFRPAARVLERGFTRGIAVTIAGRGRPWGVLTAHSGREREFTDDDAHFFQAVANVLSGAIERRRSEEEARHAALHDPLTGLANRELLLDRLARALQRNEKGRVAVLSCDVDDFKAVNVALGHRGGDDLLRAVGTRLAAHLRPRDTVARLAGDEFVVVLEGVDGATEAMRLAATARTALDEPFTVRAQERLITTSVGVAVSSGEKDAEALLRSADAAMRRAKRRGRGQQSLFDDELRERTDRRRSLGEDLRGAVGRDELSVVYQPVVAVDDGHLLAAEALVRWQHPVRGAVSPAVFIPIAEETGAIDEIGAWVLERTCRQMAEWRDLLPDDRPFTVYVNLSARQLAQADFVRRVAETLATTDTAPSRLGLEITESLLLSDVEGATRTLDALKGLGLTLAMDDFGTGYSSLSYLKRLPVDVVKVDRSFIDGLGRDAGDSAIVAAVVRMAAALHLRVTAEGVETERQLSELRTLGCDHAQGYLFARPLPADELRALL